MGHCVTLKTPFAVFTSLGENGQIGKGGKAICSFFKEPKPA